MMTTIATIAVHESRCSSRLANRELPEVQWLYTTYYKAVYQNVFYFINCKQTSEDIVQEIFISLWIRKDRLSEINDLNGYIYLMSKNFAISYMRKHKRYCKLLMDLQHLQTGRFMDDSFLEKELGQRYAEAVNLLPPQQRMIYQLGREKGLKRSQIAEHLSVSQNTVKASLQNALKSIKKSLMHTYNIGKPD